MWAASGRVQKDFNQHAQKAVGQAVLGQTFEGPFQIKPFYDSMVSNAWGHFRCCSCVALPCPHCCISLRVSLTLK